MKTGANNKAVRYEKIVTDGFKAFLGSRGYEKEGIRFRCTAKSEETIALFSHGGSGAYVISYLLNLPFPYVCSVMPYHFASVTAIELPQKYGEFVRPRLILFNDVSHLVGSSILTEG